MTPAGAIDNFLVSPRGMPILAECKLWRNPEGRREVVGQILDYAKELSRWSSSDLQREVKRRLSGSGNPLLELVRRAVPELDEMAFNDALTKNLRRGRFMLLIVGDGIREGVEAIMAHLQDHAGLHFSFGLVEMPFYRMPDGGLLATPRILARTLLVNRNVVSLPEGYGLQNSGDQAANSESDPERVARSSEAQQFWTEFLARLHLDDPEQLLPNPARIGYVNFPMPAPARTCWITVYWERVQGEIGVFLSSQRSTPGEQAVIAIAADWDRIAPELGGTAQKVEWEGRPRILDKLSVGPLQSSDTRQRAQEWLAERVNSFVNVLRPRIRAALNDIDMRSS